MYGTRHGSRAFRGYLTLDEGWPMDIVVHFLNHAGECRRMARFTRDLEVKAVWNRMADRWLMLATKERARSQQLSEIREARVQAFKPRAA
jgi:hypothetical protein